MGFSWRDSYDDIFLKTFVDEIAEAYIVLTNTKKLTFTDLVGPNKTIFFRSTDDFSRTLVDECAGYTPHDSQWGYTHFKTKKHYIDISKMESLALSNRADAGQCILDACWHEWGHSDVEISREGELLNKYAFVSPKSNKKEPWLWYRGGEVFTDTYFGMLRFEEVWNETITCRRMEEKLKMKSVFSAGDYYKNGVDFFPALTISMNITLEQLYFWHSNSRLEEFAKKIGLGLIGGETPLEKGLGLFIGIHESDPNLISQYLHKNNSLYI